MTDVLYLYVVTLRDGKTSNMCITLNGGISTTYLYSSQVIWSFIFLYLCLFFFVLSVTLSNNLERTM